MTARFVAVAAAKDLRRLRRDPISFAMWLGIPVVLAGLMSLLFGRAPVTPQGLLLVADEDGTLVSEALSAAFSRGPLGKMVLVEKTTSAEGRARIGRGGASAFLLIPKGLQKNFFENRPARLELLTNPSQRVLPQIVEETLSMAVEAGFYLQQVAGEQLRTFTGTGAPTDATVASAAVAFNRVGASVSRYLNPPLIELETAVVAEKKPQQSKSFASLFFPTTLFMSLLFIANGLALEIWRERTAGTLRRLALTPMPIAAFLAGRLLTVALLIGAVAAIGLGALVGMSDLSPARAPAAAVWLVLAGCVFFLLLLLLALQPSTERAANVWGNLLIFPLMMLGGGFMPFEMMPDWMARIGRFTPNGWALTRFKTMLEGAASPLDLVLACGVLLTIGALAFLLAARSLRRSAC